MTILVTFVFLTSLFGLAFWDITRTHRAERRVLGMLYFKNGQPPPAYSALELVKLSKGKVTRFQIYDVLRRLEAQKLIEFNVVESTPGSNLRHYAYVITLDGCMSYDELGP